MLVMKEIIKNSFGDTIVEVLIAIVILSLILTGAYVTSNNSLKNIRDAQERIQALGIAQAQAESLRSQSNTIYSTTSPHYNDLTSGTSACFDSSGNYTTAVGTASCTFSTIYKVKITPQGQQDLPSSSTYTFDINVSWASISNNQTQDHLDIYYRVGT